MRRAEYSARSSITDLVAARLVSAGLAVFVHTAGFADLSELSCRPRFSRYSIHMQSGGFFSLLFNGFLQSQGRTRHCCCSSRHSDLPATSSAFFIPWECFCFYFFISCKFNMLFFAQCVLILCPCVCEWLNFGRPGTAEKAFSHKNRGSSHEQVFKLKITRH